MTDAEVLALLTEEERSWMPPKDEQGAAAFVARGALYLLATERTEKNAAQATLRAIKGEITRLHTERDAAVKRAEDAEKKLAMAHLGFDCVSAAEHAKLQAEVTRLREENDGHRTNIAQFLRESRRHMTDKAFAACGGLKTLAALEDLAKVRGG